MEGTMKNSKRVLSLILALILTFSAFSGFTLVSRAETASETEPNNSYTTANALTSGVATTAKLDTVDDEDWFSFKSTTDGTADFTFAHAKQTENYTYFNVRVYDSKGITDLSETVLGFESAGGDESIAKSVTVKDGETYYIRVRTTNASAAKLDYTLTMGAPVPKGDLEVEPNNDAATSTAIKALSLMNGGLSSKDDVDYYLFKSNGDALLDLELTHKEAEADGVAFNVEIVDSFNNVIAVGFSYAKNAGASKTTLNINNTDISEGNYYIRVTAGAAYVNVPYQLYLQTKEAGYVKEKEPNNDAVTANALTSGKQMRGEVGSITDTDWFSFTVASKGVLDLALEHSAVAAAAAEKTVFHVDVYAADGKTVVASFDSKGSDTTASAPHEILDKGSYYAVVSAGDVVSDLKYLLNIKIAAYQGSESEPNDTVDSATYIKAAGKNDLQVYVADLKAADDVDYFGFDFANKGYIYIHFYNLRNDKNAKYKVELISLTNGSGEIKEEVIHTFTVDKNADNFKSPCIGLPAGDYIVKVTGLAYDTNAYGIGVQYTAYANFETESNNSAAAADTIPLAPSGSGAQLLVGGSCFDVNDEDWFAFTYDAERKYTITAARAFNSSELASAELDEGGAWMAFIYAPDDLEPTHYVARIDFSNNGKTVVNGSAVLESSSLKRGDYLIRVMPSTATPSSKDYQIAIKLEKKDSGSSSFDILGGFKAFVEKIKSLDWSNWGEAFAFIKTFDFKVVVEKVKLAVQSLVTIFKAIRGN